jgi:hypothetical protein
MYRLTWLCAVCACASYLNSQIFDPDLWWHVTIGRWILAHKEVPFHDYWNSFARGTPWLAYSWSNEVVYALFERVGGIHGLLLAQIILSLILTGAIFGAYGRFAHDYLIGALVGCVVAAGCISHFQLRPQTVAWICFLGVLSGSHSVAVQGYTKGAITLIVASLVMWANTHITVVLGLCTVTILTTTRERLREEPIIHAIFLCCMIFSTFLTPYLGAEWGIFFMKADHPFTHNTIIEFGPATVLEYSAAITILLAAFLATILWFSPRAVPFQLLVCCLVFFYAGFAVIKFLPFALIALGFTISCALRECSDEMPLKQAMTKLSELARKVIGPGLAFFLLALSTVLLRRLWIDPLDTRRVPKRTLDFIHERKLPHPITNAFGEGGYVMYRFASATGDLAYPVSIDGRTNVNPALIAKAYQRAYQGNQGWKSYLHLTSPETILWKNRSPFSALLLEDEDWCRVFRDGSPSEGYSVFVKESVYRSRYTEFTSDDCP